MSWLGVKYVNNMGSYLQPGSTVSLWIRLLGYTPNKVEIDHLRFCKLLKICKHVLGRLYSIFRSSPGDDLVDWNSGTSVRLYIHTSTKSFSDFHLIWCVGRPRPHMCTSVTSTRSKVKVTELPKLRKLHFSRSVCSAILAWINWWLVVIAWDLDYTLSQPDFWISF